MKIGIMTHWWDKENYGQQLQGFALQTFLRSCGHEPFLIKYSCPLKVQEQPRKTWQQRLGKVIKNPGLIYISLFIRIRSVILERRKKNACVVRDFSSFLRNHIATTKFTYYSRKELTTNEIDADVYICGSDQVWNEDWVMKEDNGRPWFLDFGRTDAKRIAYAASFGMAEVSHSYLEFISLLLCRLDGVSMRELSGVEICKVAGRNDAVVVVDPTLLIGREDYFRLFSSELGRHSPKKPYGFLYFIAGVQTNVPWKAIKKMCVNNGLETKVTTIYGSTGIPFRKFDDLTIPEWIGAIDNAAVMFTNSFHGTIFSIIMHRPFVIFLRDAKSQHEGMNTRIVSLLRLMGLESRIYDEGRNNLETQMHAPIDWSDVDKRLERLRKESTFFLSRFNICK